MSLPLDEALDLVEGVMVEWAWRRDVLAAVGGDPTRIGDLLSRAAGQPIFGKG